MEQEAKSSVGRDQVRRDAEQLQEFLRHAEYFDSEDGADQYADAFAALNRIVARVEQTELVADSVPALVEALRGIAEGTVHGDAVYDDWLIALTIAEESAREALTVYEEAK